MALKPRRSALVATGAWDVVTEWARSGACWARLGLIQTNDGGTGSSPASEFVHRLACVPNASVHISSPHDSAPDELGCVGADATRGELLAARAGLEGRFASDVGAS